MNCKNCGFLISNDDQFCPNCGHANELYNTGVNSQTPVQPVEPVVQAPTSPVVQPTEPVIQQTQVQQAQVQPTEPVIQQAQVQQVQVQPTEPVIQQAQVQPIQVQAEPVVQPFPSQAKKRNLGFTIIIIILGLIIIGLGIFIGIKLLSNNSNNKSITNNTVEEQPISDTESNTNVSYSFRGVNFTFPDNTFEVTENEEGLVAFGSKQHKCVVLLADIYELYDFDSFKLETKKVEQDLINSYLQKGFTYISSNEEKIGGIRYYSMEFSSNQGYNLSQIVAELPNESVVTGGIEYLPNGKTDAYEITSKILSTAKVENSSFANANEEIILTPITPQPLE